jgi:uncharacterized protein (TIGR02996 family)
MSDQHALFAAICAHPEEDTPRLAYADWLDENAGAMPADKRASARDRAELIRVQCALARLPLDDEDGETAARRIELESREVALLKNASRRRSWAQTPKGMKWPGGVVPTVHPNANTFVRGFPLFARGTPEQFVAQSESVFDVSPLHVLDCCFLSDSKTPQLLAAPWLARVHRLGAESLFAASADVLFAAEALANLEELHADSYTLDPPGTSVAARPLARLRRLSLRRPRNHVAVVKYERFAELLPATTRLRDFAVDCAAYSARDIAAIATLPQCAELERLTLGNRWSGGVRGAPLGPDWLRSVTAAPLWNTLRAFREEMGSLGPTEQEAEALAAAPPAPNLRALALVSDKLGTGFHAIASSPLLAPLTSLDVSGTKVGDAGATALAKSPHLGRLVRLHLAYCHVGPKGVRALAEAPFAANLVRLDLRGCPIQKGGIDALVAPGNFPRLLRLDAGGAAKNTAQKERLRARFGDAVRF